MGKYDVIVVGAGFAGSVSARALAERGKRVLILESRDHIGGNAYDFMDENGVLQHMYGPHIFHTCSEKVINFLSRFTEWYPYEHRVLGLVDGKNVPILFNLKSIELCFSEEKATHLKEALIRAYGKETKIPILELLNHSDPEIKVLAEFIFENVFKYYTMKQWDYSAEEIDPSVTGRVPVSISYDDRYFGDYFQKMPKDGYTMMFKQMLDHYNISIELNCDATSRLKVDQVERTIYFDGEEFEGDVIYSGVIDALFDYQLGELSYRSLDFDVQTKDGTYQECATINYPTPKEVHPFTRITEFKYFMDNKPEDKTTIAIEYPLPYNRHGEKGNVPYYPVFTEESKAQYQQYQEMAIRIPNLHLLGRLAEFRYYNMDEIAESALELVERLG